MAKKSKQIEEYIDSVNIPTDVCAFICSVENVRAYRAAFNRKKKNGQRLSFRVRGGTAYGIIAMEGTPDAR